MNDVMLWGGCISTFLRLTKTTIVVGVVYSLGVKTRGSSSGLGCFGWWARCRRDRSSFRRSIRRPRRLMMGRPDRPGRPRYSVHLVELGLLGTLTEGVNAKTDANSASGPLLKLNPSAAHVIK